MIQRYLVLTYLLAIVPVTCADTRTEAMNSVPPSPESQVTFMNWSEQPFNHWSFKNVGIAPSLMVPRGGDIVQIPTEIDAQIANIEFQYEGETFTVHDSMIGDSTDGYLVLKDGKIVFEHYFNGFSEHNHHLWASCTKSLVGLSMGILVDQGKVVVEDLVETYIPELEGTYFGQRTVRDVLNMVSAIDYSEDYENFTPGAVSTEYFRRLGFIPAFDLMAIDPSADNTPRGIIEYLPKFEGNPDLEPRVKYEYHSPNVDVAGWIIARVSGMPLNEFIAKNVWTKIGAEHDAFFMSDVAFNPIATGGFNTTLRDFARVGLVVLNNGSYNGNQIFPESWVADTFNLSDDERSHMDRSAYKETDGPVYDEWLEGYKNYMWVHDAEKEIGTFRGVFGQHLYINRKKQLVVATFSSAASASNAARASNRPRLAAFEAIANYFK
jgi:CubicO group peptidase (beta-lactamase class C family)